MTSLFDDVDVDALPDVLAPSIRLRNRLTAERLDSSHLPQCPHCQELNFPGLARCANCCSPLFKRLGRGAITGSREAQGRRDTSGLTQPLPATLCPTCLVECDDLTCPICGGLLGKAA